MLCPPDIVKNLTNFNIHCGPECGELGALVIVGGLASGMLVSKSNRTIMYVTRPMKRVCRFTHVFFP